MTTIKDVAKLAGVSISTVSVALNGAANVSPELMERINAAVAQLDYTPSATARSLKRGVTKLIGLLVADITNPFYSEMMEVIEAEAQRGGYSLILANSAQDVDKERTYLRLMQSHRVDGLIVSVSARSSRETLVDFQRTKIPTVLVDRTFPGLTFDSVLLDNQAAGMAAVDLAIGMGHRRIGIIGGPSGISSSEERLRGYRDALAAAGIPFDPALVAPGDFTIDGGYEAARLLLTLPRPPTAMFSANNSMAIGMMRCVAEMGLRCPDDISVLSIDDFPWAEAFTPRLTTVAQPLREMGRRVVRLLIDRIEGRGEPGVAQHIFQPQLRQRDSVAPPRS
jgi:LacI family transcriptional regulator